MSERRPPIDPVPWTPEDEAAMEQRQAELTVGMLRKPASEGAPRGSTARQKITLGMHMGTTRGPLLEPVRRPR